MWLRQVQRHPRALTSEQPVVQGRVRLPRPGTSYFPCMARGSQPPPSHKDSIYNMSRQFNVTLSVYHMFLEGERILHAMEASSRYVAGMICDTKSIASSISAIQTVCLVPVWSLSSMQVDQAFINASFKEFCHNSVASFQPVPPRRHSKNVFESKPGVPGSIFF